MAEPERRKSAREVQELYADLAPEMDRMAWLNRLVTGRHRRRLFGKARGRTLDVACGLGLNRRYLPEDVEYVGVDLSPEMLARFQRWRADAHYEKHGCRWDQAPLEVVAGAELPVLEHRTSLLGILTAIEARPA